MADMNEDLLRIRNWSFGNLLLLNPLEGIWHLYIYFICGTWGHLTLLYLSHLWDLRASDIYLFISIVHVLSHIFIFISIVDVFIVGLEILSFVVLLDGEKGQDLT